MAINDEEPNGIIISNQREFLEGKGKKVLPRFFFPRTVTFDLTRLCARGGKINSRFDYSRNPLPPTWSTQGRVSGGSATFRITDQMVSLATEWEGSPLIALATMQLCRGEQTRMISPLRPSTNKDLMKPPPSGSGQSTSFAWIVCRSTTTGTSVIGSIGLNRGRVSRSINRNLHFSSITERESSELLITVHGDWSCPVDPRLLLFLRGGGAGQLQRTRGRRNLKEFAISKKVKHFFDFLNSIKANKEVRFANRKERHVTNEVITRITTKPFSSRKSCN